jgi:FeS assembly SUF system protein
MGFWRRDKKQESDAAEAPQAAEPVTGGTSTAALPSDAPPAPSTAGAPPAKPEAVSSPAEDAPAGPISPIDATVIEAKVVEAIRTCYDPEIPVNIYELGLIYEVDVKPTGQVEVKMTLTSPMCPVAGTLPHEVEAKVSSVSGVTSAQVDVVWDPPWTPEKMSEAAKLQLGML